MRTRLAFALAALLLTIPLAAGAAITIVNMDAAGEGFNDPTPAAPVGGNPGTTVGQQRLNVFQQAAAIWDAILRSPVEIRVQASFDPLSCTATSAVLGSAGPNTVESDFAGATFPATWYVTAEANRITGTDLEPGFDDIVAQFNSNIGAVGCLTGRSWYYGYDGNEGTGIDLLPVLLHEFGHGLGFLSTTDATTGVYFAGQPSIFDRFLLDDVTHKHWHEMTAAERLASAINTEHLVWDGPLVTATGPNKLGKRAHVATSGALAGDFVGGEGLIGAPLTVGGVTANVVLANDGVGTTSDGCESPWVNAAAIAGRIALVDRSASCSFATQAIDAQVNGAVALVIVNNAAGPAPPVRGTAAGVTIPVVSLSQADGNAIRTALGSGAVLATVGLDAAHFAGANNAGQVRMFAPNPVQPGSSVSHWDVSAFPNLLMEPAINPDLGTNPDLTYEAFVDMGWPALPASVTGGPGAAVAFSHGPNPAREGGTLRFRVPVASRVELAIYDPAGRRVARLANATLGAGEHAIEWSRRDGSGRRVGPGVYLARLRVGADERTLHIVLVD
jgi:hypothetical protein